MTRVTITYAWINATVISKILKIAIIVIDTKEFEYDIKEKLDSNEIKRCPATMFADNRTDKVIGRIMFLTISMITIKFISGVGVPIGVM